MSFLLQGEPCPLPVFPLCSPCPLCETCLTFKTCQLKSWRSQHTKPRDPPWDCLGTPDFSPACLFFFRESLVPCQFFLCVLCALCANPAQFPKHANLKVGVPRRSQDLPKETGRLEVGPTSFLQSFLCVLCALCVKPVFQDTYKIVSRRREKKKRLRRDDQTG